jgi:hypothetical protein
VWLLAGVVALAAVLAAAVATIMSVPFHGLVTSTVSFSVLLALMLSVGLDVTARPPRA